MEKEEEMKLGSANKLIAFIEENSEKYATKSPRIERRTLSTVRSSTEFAGVLVEALGDHIKATNVKSAEFKKVSEAIMMKLTGSKETTPDNVKLAKKNQEFGSKSLSYENKNMKKIVDGIDKIEKDVMVAVEAAIAKKFPGEKIHNWDDRTRFFAKGRRDWIGLAVEGKIEVVMMWFYAGDKEYILKNMKIDLIRGTAEFDIAPNT